MNWFLLILGLGLLLVAAFDAFWTALWVDAAPAPLSTALSTAIWKATRALVPRERRQLRSLAGPLSLAGILVMWILLVWAGWTLILSADPDALMSARATKPVDLSGRIYFVAFTMFTMGNGDFFPVGDGWELVVSLITASGMVLVTVAISYILSVLPAIVQTRTLSSQIHGLGDQADRAVVGWWNGREFPGLERQLNAIASAITLTTQQHSAYPILHVYRGSQKSTARGTAIAVFDEALTLLTFGLADGVPLAPGVLGAARSSVRSFLHDLDAAGIISPAAAPPPAPDLSNLRAAGIPTVDDETFASRLEDLAERRRLLLGLVQHDGYQWPGS